VLRGGKFFRPISASVLTCEFIYGSSDFRCYVAMSTSEMSAVKMSNL
jgi:hypothetical protein